ncbi:MAG: DUF971 domain-containing protein [Parachlamydiaceae bacterium]
MKNLPILIKTIRQQDNCHFVIEWSDGSSKNYRLGDLQRNCPCAKCYDPGTGKQVCSETDLDPNVRAIQIKSVGRYALKVQFASGCSRGIYSFSMLHMWK